MKTPVEILQERYMFYDPMIQQKDVELCGEQVIEMMEAYAEQFKNCNLHDVSQRSELLIDFLIHLNNKKLINNHDFDYEKEAKKYSKKLINCG